jgi:uncharacterized NAD-dependent epimerase/dehydratase family protein
MNARKSAKGLLEKAKMFAVIGILDGRMEVVTGGGMTADRDDPLIVHVRSLLEMLSAKVPIVNSLHEGYIKAKKQADLVEKAKAKRSQILSLPPL